MISNHLSAHSLIETVAYSSAAGSGEAAALDEAVGLDGALE